MRIKKLGDYIEITKGKKHQISEERSNKSIRFIQIDDLRNNDNIKLTDDCKGVSVVPDDLIIAWDGANAGTIGFGKEGFIGSTLARLRKKDKLSYDTIFLAKFLQSKFSFLRKTSTGATIPHINRKALDSIILPNVEFEDQIRIANILSQAEALIAKRKESIQLLDELLKSTFLDMFGDPVRNEKGFNTVKEIKDICQFKGGGTPSKSKAEYYTGDIPWVSPKDMKFLYITTSQDKITEKAIKESSTNLIEKGAVLMVVRSGILKSKLPVAINNIEVALNQDMKAFRSTEVLSQYLLYYFISNERNILKKVRATTADNLNFEDIKSLKIIVPPITLQTQFAQIVEKVESMKTKYQESLQELENLYASLSQKAFKGELDLSKMEIEEQKLDMAAEEGVGYGKKA